MGKSFLGIFSHFTEFVCHDRGGWDWKTCETIKKAEASGGSVFLIFYSLEGALVPWMPNYITSLKVF